MKKMFGKKEEYTGPVDQYGRPLEVEEPKRSAEDDRHLIKVIFTSLAIVTIIVVLIIFGFNYFHQNSLKIPTATLSTTEWTKDDVVVTVDTSRGSAEEFSIDGGLTWQESNKFVITKNQELSIQVRTSSGKVSKPASLVVSNIDKDVPDLYFIDSYVVAVGSKFDPRENVTATDSGAGLDEYNIDTSVLDLSTPGEYVISYYLSDMVGNEVLKTRKIIVEPTLSEYRYRSRSVAVTESQCRVACRCDNTDEEGKCPTGTYLDKESGACCESCMEPCLKTEYGEWSNWQEKRLLPTKELEVQMITKQALEQLILEEQQAQAK